MGDVLTRPWPTHDPPGPEADTPGGEEPGSLTTTAPLGPLRRPPDQARWRPGTPWSDRVGRAREGCRHLAGRRHFDSSLVVVLMALSLALRWRTLWASYWGDEAIAIGIAVHPISALPHYLVNDGSPPLYYVMLHYWMRLFGQSEPATHLLSLIPGLACVPAAWWSASRLFGRWAARASAAMVATCAYLAYYSTETRMYSWLVLTAILAVTCFVLAFQGAGRRYWVMATLLMACVLYFQYYGLYLLAATVIVGSLAAAGAGSWSQLRATWAYGTACAALFAPWVPQFLYQLRNTGAPWAPHPSPLDFFGDSFNALASAAWAAIVVCLVVAVRDRRRRPRPVRRPPRRLVDVPRARPGVLVFGGVALTTLVLAWLVGQVVNSWNPRYLGIAVVPALVPLAGALSRARGRTVVLVGTVAALAATSVPLLVDRSITVETSKSDVGYLASELASLLRPGALVISPEVTDTPVVAIDLGAGYRYATPFGLLSDPMAVNWSNLTARLESTNGTSNIRALLNALPVGGQVLVVNPTSWGGGETPRTYAGPVEAEAIAATTAVLTDPQLQYIIKEGVPQGSSPLYPMTATLFVKIQTASNQPASGEGGI